MIYLLSREGQMCNQLLSLAMVCSLGVEYNTDVVCPVIDERLKEYFVFNADINGIRIKTYYSSKWRTVSLFYKALKKFFGYESNARFNPDKSNKNQYFLDRISFFEPEIFANHTDDIRDFLDFQPVIKEKCKSQIDRMRKNGFVLVGVHIRRGDYKEFQGGKWYYTDDEYTRWMRHLAEDKNVQFLICSNESVDLELYKAAGLDVSQPGKSAIDDLCLLSMCDYVMGPPSTYSLWAAMIGGKKRWILDERTCDISWGGGKTIGRKSPSRRSGSIAA